MDVMDLAAFFRIAISVVLAIFSVGLILAINVIFFGNTYYILKNCFKRGENKTEFDQGPKREKIFEYEKPNRIDRKLPKAG